MHRIDFAKSIARDAAVTTVSADGMEVVLGGGGGVTLNGAERTNKRYIVGNIEVLEEHSIAMMLRFFLPGAKKARI